MTTTFVPEFAFAPLLHKRTWPNENPPREWGTWHYHADLPLTVQNEVFCTWA